MRGGGLWRWSSTCTCLLVNHELHLIRLVLLPSPHIGLLVAPPPLGSCGLALMLSPVSGIGTLPGFRVPIFLEACVIMGFKRKAHI